MFFTWNMDDPFSKKVYLQGRQANYDESDLEELMQEGTSNVPSSLGPEYSEYSEGIGSYAQKQKRAQELGFGSQPNEVFILAWRQFAWNAATERINYTGNMLHQNRNKLSREPLAKNLILPGLLAVSWFLIKWFHHWGDTSLPPFFVTEVELEPGN